MGFRNNIFNEDEEGKTEETESDKDIPKTDLIQFPKKLKA